MRTYSTELKCGCLIATLDEDGWEGLISCGADEYTRAELKRNSHFRMHKKQHDEEWERVHLV